MKKLAVLRCLITSASCAATGCFTAFNERNKQFSRYEGEDVQLAAMWTCNGCGKSMLENQEGINKKIERMSKNEISVVHLSNCCTKTREDGTKYLCPKIVKIAEKLKENGIEIVNGTHHTDK